jgi:hypothetical protein
MGTDMSFRTLAITAVLTLLGFAVNNPASAQPIVPQRPHTSPFGGLFGPSSNAVPNVGLMPLGPNNVPGAGQNQQMLLNGLGGPLLNPFANTTPGPGDALNSAEGGQPVVFNNRGRWYSNYYGHWYPGGVKNGSGVLSTSGFGGVGGLSGGAAGIGGAGIGSGAGGGSPVIGVSTGMRR